MCKKCTKCGEIKDLNQFNKQSSAKDGLAYCCKVCKTLQNSSREISLVCQNPECLTPNFINFKKRKYCFNCYPLRRPTITYEDCLKTALICKTRLDFAKKFPSHYQKCCVESWLDSICKHMPVLKSKFTFDECAREALLYTHRSDFSQGSSKHYNYARSHGWLDKICVHMVNKRGGRGKTNFSSDCEKYNNGKGILYLIKCWNAYETFYKIGITSQSVKKRHKSTKYNYEIIWEIQENSSQIWDLEKQKHRESKKFRYQPKLWKNKSLETFKCHGNCKILRKPNLI